MRIDGTFDQLLTGFHQLTLLNLQTAAVVDGIGLGFAGIVHVGDGHFALLLVFAQRDAAADLGQDSVALRLAGLEKFLDAGKTLRDVLATGDTAGMEGTHGQLGAGLTDSLSGDDTHGFAHVHGAAGGQVHAVAAGAHTSLIAAGQHAANLNLGDTGLADQLGLVVGNGLVEGDQNLACFGMHHILGGHAAHQTVFQTLNDLIVDADFLQRNAADLLAPGFETILLADDDFLRHVHQTAGQVTRVSGTQSGISQRLTAAMRGQEELQHLQTFTEVRANGQFQRAAGRRSHQAAHAGQLGDLRRATTSAGVGHHTNGVELVQTGKDHVPQGGGGGVPDIHDLGIAFFLAHHTHAVQAVDLLHLRVGSGHDLGLFLGNLNIRHGNGNSADGGVLEAQILDIVQHLSCIVDAMLQVHFIDDLAQFLLAAQGVDLQREHFVQAGTGLAADILRDHRVEQQTAQRAVDGALALFAVELPLNADADGSLQAQLTQLIRHHGFVGADEGAARALAVLVDDGQVIAADNHVLRGRHNRLTILRLQDVVVGQHQEAGFRLRFHGQRHVDSHLVAVEVGVEGGADQRMQLDGATFHQHGFESLNAQTVQRRRTVQQHGVLLDDFFQNVPDLGTALFHHALGVLAMVRLFQGHQTLDNEGFEQLQRHFLRHAALIQLQLGADDDNGTAGVVNALAQQVLTETSLLAAQQIAQRLQSPVAGARHGTAAAAIVDQSVNSFLQHTLFIADDDIRRAQLQQSLQTVVTVDDAAVQVVQVAGGEASAVQLHHGAQVRGNDGHHVQDHPLGLVVAQAEGFHHLQPLDGAGALLTFGLAVALLLGQFGDLLLQLDAQIVQIEGLQHLLDGLSTHSGAEAALAALGFDFTILGIGDQLILLQAGLVAVAGIQHDKVGEIQHLLQRAGADVQQHTHAAGDSLEVPDMADGRGQLNMAHALAAHLGAGDLHAALVADLVLILELDALILTAVAFPVLGRSKDAFAEQAVALGLQGAVVNGFGLANLAVAPLEDLLRRCHSDLDGIQIGQFKQNAALPFGLWQ